MILCGGRHARLQRRSRQAAHQPRQLSRAEFRESVTDAPMTPSRPPGFQRVIQRAGIHVQSSGREEVTGANVLIAIFAERESHAAYFLQEQDLTRYDAVTTSATASPSGPGGLRGAPGARRRTRKTETKGNEDQEEAGASRTYCVNLTRRRATARSIRDRRNSEINSSPSRSCAAGRRINPLFVGEAGVGKTRDRGRSAKRIVDQARCPEVLAAATVFSLAMGTLLAGTRYRGDFEERLRNRC